MVLSKMIKRMGIIAVVVVLSLTFSIVSNAALLGWDLVDDGKHLDWDGNTKYTSSVASAVKLWEGYKPGVIRPDSAWVIEDVYLSDFYQVSSTMAVTSSAGTIKFNDYHYSGMTTNQRIKTTTHEFGHALGLDHTYGTYDIMQQGKLSLTSLSTTDKRSYDEAYKTY
ncbi:M43 family zinc metalloprotease [Rubeoparvulum massiliense]|uniref:M43 family zinc metalloprotease n=1 Tax=Rubeoparvulum massiliense TaxID=1631346 RepID=UPI0009753A53|nr:M43 family zinc metalloprotease [Rubeoparvulum massiliense]